MADAGIEKDLLVELQNAFHSDKKNLVVQNVGTQYDPLEVCLNRNVVETVSHVYKHKVSYMPSQDRSAIMWEELRSTRRTDSVIYSLQLFRCVLDQRLTHS